MVFEMLIGLFGMYSVNIFFSICNCIFSLNTDI